MLDDIRRRDQLRAERKRRGRVALGVDMLKSYAGPVILAAFLNPILQGADGRFLHLGLFNYLLLIAGLAMICLALIFAPAKD